MRPEDATVGYRFAYKSATFFVGLFPHSNKIYAGTQVPVLLLAEGDDWAEVERLDPLWETTQKEFTPPEAFKQIVTKFNTTIVAIGSNAEPTWIEQLSRLFRECLTVGPEGLEILDL